MYSRSSKFLALADDIYHHALACAPGKASLSTLSSIAGLLLFLSVGRTHWLLILLCAAVVQWMLSCCKAWNSTLTQLPGPWYAPFTNLHLQYLFSRGTVPDFVQAAHARYGPVVRLGPRQVWISDKAALKQILSTVDLPKVAMYAEISREKESAGLFGEVRPSVHTKLKKMLSPSFTVGYCDKLDQFFQKPLIDTYNVYRKELAKCAREGKPLVLERNFMEDIHKIALEIMGECCFGRGFGSVAAEKATPEPGIDLKTWLNIPNVVFSGTKMRYRLVYLKRFLRTCGINLQFDWPYGMMKAIDLVVRRRQAQLKSPDPEFEPRQDLLQHLVTDGKRPDNGVKMNSRDILDQMGELLLAGTETTSATIAYLFLELARNPDVKEKLFRTLPAMDLADALVDGKTVRSDPQYEYLQACIKENLRMHPIASEMGRKTGKEPVLIGGFVYPPHTVISASYKDLHYNPAYWPEPNRFWPERFLSKDSPLHDGVAPAYDSSAYWPFSGGAHSCIGMNFAWHEQRIVAANMLSRFDIEELAQPPLKLRQFITIQFHDGKWMARLKPRLPVDGSAFI
ncbi:Cytochrome-P450 monooxygenase FUS8 [Teratosphaeria destructans]|uniref:Cytochrome-P450 monooxygenase FUS8 n=1 Tax=Teratosphaeria destructans TaxID=418781 RepID=A0A9W7SS59_9PEZI|nr:Cytochrome-P450 monooxygenase FUS8 [Teratosphaeria destructans]